MKLKFRKFDENEYKEIECDYFIFTESDSDIYETTLNTYIGDIDNCIHKRYTDVCEVIVEEI